jgi:hypothetical protein
MASFIYNNTLYIDWNDIPGLRLWPVTAPTWNPAPMYGFQMLMGAPPVPYYGYYGNISHGYGHVSSNGHNNGVQHPHNTHGPVEDLPPPAPVEAQTVEDDSSATTSAQYRHSPHRFIPCTVRLPPAGGNGGSSADTCVPAGSPSIEAAPVDTQTVEIDSGYNSMEYYFSLYFFRRRRRPLWFDVRLPPTGGNGSSTKISVQHHHSLHGPAERLSTARPAEAGVAETGSSTLSPLARPYQPQHDRAEMMLRDPRHGTLAPKTKRERRKLAKKVRAEAEAEAAKAAGALSVAGGDGITSSPKHEEEEEEEVEKVEEASHTGCGIVSRPVEPQWTAVCRSVRSCQAAAGRNAVGEDVCESPDCDAASDTDVSRPRVDSFEFKDIADKVSSPRPRLTRRGSVASCSSPPSIYQEPRPEDVDRRRTQSVSCAERDVWS